MNKRHTLANKYMLLAMIIIAMLVMSGCRTRITNNSEVSNVHYDEDGFLSEVYQMRRDELGLSTAERPILPDLGTPEADDDFDNSEDENALQNYEPEVEEPYVEPPQTNTNTNTNTNSGTGTTTRPSYNTPRPSRSTNILVTYDTNGGEAISGGKSVVKGEKYGDLPTPTRKDHTFTGWNTAKDGSGSTITKDSKVTKSSNHTLYAQWKKNESGGGDTPTPKPETTYTVTFVDGQGNTLKVQDGIAKNGAAEAPSDPEREGYTFKEWDVAFDNITENITVTAVWTRKQDYTYWNVTFREEKNKIKDEPKCFVTGGASEIVQDCKANAKEDETFKDEADFAVVFLDGNLDPTEDSTKAIVSNIVNNEYKTFADNGKLLIISKYGTKDNSKLVHKIAIINWLHSGKVENLDQAVAETELETNAIVYYPEP